MDVVRKTITVTNQQDAAIRCGALQEEHGRPAWQGGPLNIAY
jgi:hypothetical protein